MGRITLPWYGEDLGSAIETVEKIIAKIKTNKFTKKELEQLAQAVAVVQTVIDED